MRRLKFCGWVVGGCGDVGGRAAEGEARAERVVDAGRRGGAGFRCEVRGVGARGDEAERLEVGTLI